MSDRSAPGTIRAEKDKPQTMSERTRERLRRRIGVVSSVCPACGQAPRGSGGIEAIAKQIGVSAPTIKSFLKGGLPRTAQLDMIISWLDAQAEKKP